MKQRFVTLFDHRYAARGLALFGSLRLHCPSFELWVVALTPACVNICLAQACDELKVIPLAELESAMPALLVAKANRNTKEYYYTLSSAVCVYVLRQIGDNDLLTYLDADTYLFTNPSDVFAELENYSIGITRHNFTKRRRKMERYGVYNVGWVSFRNDREGVKCLEWWFSSCLTWCYEREENGRYADQKYLDAWPTMFQRVRVIETLGVNVAPWNIGNHKLSVRKGLVHVDGRKIVMYHFADLAEVLPRVIDTQIGVSGVFVGPIIRWFIYRPYIEHLYSISPVALQRGIGPNVLSRVIGGATLKQVIRVLIGFATCQYLLRLRGRSVL